MATPGDLGKEGLDSLKKVKEYINLNIIENQKIKKNLDNIFQK
jgi:hypothetical protein